MIRAEQLGKTYQDKPVLRGLDFAIQPGELVVLQGANGAGKTTLLRILATLTRPGDGDALIKGISIRKDPMEVRKHIGVMLHQPMVYGDLSAMENLAFFASLAELKNSNKHCRDLLEQMALDPCSPKRVRSYSRGMMQRLSLARAFITDPPVLLLDEPFTGLDAANQDHLLEILVYAARQGKTLLVTDHDTSRAVKMASRVDYLIHGQITRSFAGSELQPEFLENAIRQIEGSQAQSPGDLS